MQIEFDPAKSERNERERGLAFSRVAEFDFETEAVVVDTRRDYGEIRYRAVGWLDGRLHALVFVRAHLGVRVISLRKANQRKVKRYEQEAQP